MIIVHRCMYISYGIDHNCTVCISTAYSLHVDLHVRDIVCHSFTHAEIKGVIAKSKMQLTFRMNKLRMEGKEGRQAIAYIRVHTCTSIVASSSDSSHFFSMSNIIETWGKLPGDGAISIIIDAS